LLRHFFFDGKQRTTRQGAAEPPSRSPDAYVQIVGERNAWIVPDVAVTGATAFSRLVNETLGLSCETKPPPSEPWRARRLPPGGDTGAR